jgi:hypothetical protein
LLEFEVGRLCPEDRGVFDQDVAGNYPGATDTRLVAADSDRHVADREGLSILVQGESDNWKGGRVSICHRGDGECELDGPPSTLSEERAR